MTCIKKFGIIGVGAMARAILSGVYRERIFEPQNITLFDKFSDNYKLYANDGMNIARSAEEVIRASDIILIAVRPQDVEKLYNEISPFTAGKCLFTIAAGISSDYIRAHVSEGTYVIRCMPNMGIMLGCGASVLAVPKGDVPSEYFDTCKEILGKSGIVEIMDESMLNIVVSVNGSSPAYFYKLINAICDYAEYQGIDRASAERLAIKTMEGASRMLLKGDHTAKELIAAVATPGGTTEAAVNTMDDMDFNGLIANAMASCTGRTTELSK